MKTRGLYALAAALVVGAFSLLASSMVLTWAPRHERFVSASGKLIEPKRSTFLDFEFRRDRRKRHVYNAVVWTLAGFALSLLMTFLFPINGFPAAAALGLKVALTLLAVQSLVVFIY